MKEIIIAAILLLVFFVYVGELSVTIEPFSISLPYWHRSVGLLLLGVAFVVYHVGEHTSGYRKGLEDGKEIAIKAILEKCEKEKGDSR